MIEKYGEVLYSGGITGAVLTDLSKEFDYISHNLLTAKLHGYGVEKVWLDFIHSYLTKRKQRTIMVNAPLWGTSGSSSGPFQHLFL